MLKNNPSVKSGKRGKRKSRPKYLSHPAFIALVVANIAAAGYGAYLWSKQNEISFFKESASVKVILGDSRAVAGKTKKQDNHFEEKDSSQLSISAQLPAADSIHTSSQQETVRLEGDMKKDSSRINSSNTPAFSPPVAKKEKIEIVQAPLAANIVASPPMLEVSPELISHNGIPGKAKPFIQVEKKSDQVERTHYTVAKGLAHFHNQPDGDTRRKAFINHWNKAILKPIDDQNGFIYIVYTNHLGQTSRGWLDKKDLQALNK